MWNFTERAHQLSLDFKEMIDGLNDVPEPFKEFIKAWVNILADGNAAEKKLLNYLMYMTERLILMKRILKNTGTIYFHCDPKASHYIKVIMDGIFGRHNFRNEIVWWYDTGGMAKKDFSRKHDIILRYVKSNNWTFNVDAIKTEKNKKQKERYELAKKWGDNSTYRLTSIKKYPHDVIQMHAINPKAKERRGYDTQKPLALLNRIIKASSNEGDLVLDTFCGCGTTIAGAIELNRNWIGIDISGDAVNEIEDRIQEMKKVHLGEGCKYNKIESNPETKREYERLTPYEKQDWLIRKIGGLPNPKKSGDSGIDGEKTIHLGDEKWGKMIFSVKTGKQSNPVFIRELLGTMEQSKSVMGGLILDIDPTLTMEETAEKAGQLKYELITNNGEIAEQTFNKIQILTSQEIIDGKYFIHPPTLSQKKKEKRHQGDLI
ncbi:MAG: DNA-methyltransferase [Alphaproteobacteria bacterium]